jgi:Uncharacterized protein conserved in bacteria (DUF2252)
VSTSRATPPKVDDRSDRLEKARTKKMARSPQAYVRGNTDQFYRWLEGPLATDIPEGPPVWICGDCHVGNLGPVADANGRVRVHIRDLDQATIGNPAHDLKNDSVTYGVFAAVLGLVAFIYLGSQITIYAAELNTVLAGHLWPRGMVQPPLTEADQRSLALQATQNQRRPEQEVSVEFTTPAMSQSDWLTSRPDETKDDEDPDNVHASPSGEPTSH